MAKRITFEQWSERPAQLKPGKEAVLRDIERRPGEFTFFNDVSVKDSKGGFVVDRRRLHLLEGVRSLVVLRAWRSI